MNEPTTRTPRVFFACITLFGRVHRTQFPTLVRALNYQQRMEYRVGIPCHIETETHK